MDKCVKMKFTEGLNMYTYLMLTMRTEKFNQEHVAGHYEFLDRLQAEKRLKMFGPFSDATGGAYVIEADSLEEAAEIAMRIRWWQVDLLS
jgi:uncharacterized protein YciI